MENHQLDAPDVEELEKIEQIPDHSELSSLYFKPGQQWKGEILSKEERDKKKQQEKDEMSFGMRPKFWQVGLLAPLPFIALAFCLTVNYLLINVVPIMFLLFPMIIVYMLWIVFLIYIFRTLSAMFYRNALRAGPFLLVLYVFLFLSLQIVFLSGPTFSLDHQVLIPVAVLSASSLVLSVVFSFIQLYMWTTPRMNGGSKVAVIGGMVLILGSILAAIVLV